MRRIISLILFSCFTVSLLAQVGIKVNYNGSNATKRMVACDPPGFEIQFDGIYELPRIGKDIVYTKWNVDGTSKRKVLKWNGSRFVSER